MAARFDPTQVQARHQSLIALSHERRHPRPALRRVHRDHLLVAQAWRCRLPGSLTAADGQHAIIDGLTMGTLPYGDDQIIDATMALRRFPALAAPSVAIEPKCQPRYSRLRCWIVSRDF
jgi:hypothetical protein